MGARLLVLGAEVVPGRVQGHVVVQQHLLVAHVQHRGDPLLLGRHMPQALLMQFLADRLPHPVHCRLQVVHALLHAVRVEAPLGLRHKQHRLVQVVLQLVDQHQRGREARKVHAAHGAVHLRARLQHAHGVADRLPVVVGQWGGGLRVAHLAVVLHDQRTHVQHCHEELECARGAVRVQLRSAQVVANGGLHLDQAGVVPVGLLQVLRHRLAAHENRDHAALAGGVRQR
mmetsp:Transcript_12922/g.32677  ORF Transcript_12922/g.32677 Transcript_12922/m.32677 type:complete len:229 (+) Transcript_12922:715-1401(+)